MSWDLSEKKYCHSCEAMEEKKVKCKYCKDKVTIVNGYRVFCSFCYGDETND